MSKRLDMVIVRSRSCPGLVSLRMKEDDATATSIRRALTEAGFKAGDRVKLVPVQRAKAKP